MCLMYIRFTKKLSVIQPQIFTCTITFAVMLSVVKKPFIVGNTTAFGCYRIVIHNSDGREEVWFKAKEVATFLNYKKPGDAIRNNVDPIWQKTWKDLTTASYVTQRPLIPSNWHPNTIFISEAGMYALLMRSKKPEAVKFQEWVCEYVLPSIRRTGEYKMPENTGDRQIDNIIYDFFSASAPFIKADDALIVAIQDRLKNTHLTL